MSDTDTPVISGWREALVSVADVEPWLRFYQTVGGWEIRHQGPVDAATLEFLGLPAGTTANETLVAEPGVDTGFTRLICFADGHQNPVIRSNARPWETGGWYDLNSRVDDMGARFTDIGKLGWRAESDPIEWNFSGRLVSEWLVNGPDGVSFAFIERLDPPLPPEERPGALSAHINATQFVADIEAARHIYQEILGFNALIEVSDEFFIPEPAPNVLGLPAEAAAKQKWNISLQAAPGEAGGWVEILSLPGISGRSFADRTDPPNRGIISLRFPVNDLVTLHTHLLNNDVEIVQTPQTLSLAPYGEVSMLTARGPCGARLDFFQIA